MKKHLLLLLGLLITSAVFSQSKLVFSYDSASNQVERKYCPNGNCSSAKNITKKEPIQEEVIEEMIAENDKTFDNSLAIFPNPTKGLLTMKWDRKYSNSINEIILIDVSSKAHPVSYKLGNHEANIDLSNWPIGLYIIKFILKDGTTLTKKIIKK